MATTPTSSGSAPRMSGQKRTLQARARAAAALAMGATQEQAALVAGVNVRTIRRWMDAGLDTEIAQARFDQGVKTAAVLCAAAGTAASVLAAILEAVDVPAATKVRAASIVLQHARDWRETEEFERRLQQIEERINSDS